MYLVKRQWHEILKEAFRQAAETDIQLHYWDEEFHQYHDTEQNSGWAKSPNMHRLASRLVCADGDLQADTEEIQPYIDELNEYFQMEVERLRSFCSFCGSLGFCGRPLLDDGYWVDE